MNPYSFRIVCDVRKHLNRSGNSDPSSTIEAFAVSSHRRRTILALACGSEILFLLSKNDGEDDEDGRSIDSDGEGDFEINSIPWANTNQTKTVSCMTFSPCGRWLACVLITGAIEIIPVSMALQSKSTTIHASSASSLFPFNEMTTIDLRIRDDCLGLPTCVVWYETKQKRHMLVYSNKGGDILFVDLVVRRLSASLQAPQSIHNLEIIEEAAYDDVYLLASGFAGTQWLVPLEQRNMTLRETLARIVPSELKELNVRGLVHSVRSGGCNCLGVLHEDVFRLFNTTNFGSPIMELLLPENTFAVRYTDVLTFSIHKQVIVSYSFNCCSTSDYASETREQFTAVLGELPECRFLGCYALTDSTADGQFDEEIRGLPSCLFVTETSVYMAAPKWTTREYLANLLLTDKKLTSIELYCQAVGLNFQTSCFDSIPALLERKAVERALQICNLSKAPLYSIAKQFVDRGFASFILPQILSWLSNGPGGYGANRASSTASEQTKRELSHLAFELFLETCKSSRGLEKNKADQDFRNFLLHNVWYDPDYCMKTLLEIRLYDFAAAVVKVHGLYENLAKEIITMDGWEANDESFISLISLPGLSGVLLDGCSTYCHHYLARLERLLPELDVADRVRFLRLFDPERDEMKKLLESARSTKPTGRLGMSQKSLTDDVVRFFLSSFVSYLFDRSPSPSTVDRPDEVSNSIHQSSSTPMVRGEPIPIACGAEHTCVYSSDGILYAFGRARYGSLGDRLTHPAVTYSTPIPVVFPAKIDVLRVACGSDHTICLERSGRLYSWGSNKYGQLGIGTKDITQSDKPVEVLLNTTAANDAIMTKIECGQYHTFGVDGSGDAWGWGWNVHRQVGVGHRANDIIAPTRLDYFREKSIKVDSVSCGYAHTIFLTTDGRLYGCGNNAYGQLAMYDVKKMAWPTRLRLGENNGERFELIASGFFHNIALTRNRRMITWGATPQALKFKALLQKRKNQQQQQHASGSSDPNGQKHIASSESTSTIPTTGVDPSNSRQIRPSLVDLSGLENGETIVQLSCGFHHSLLRTADGRLYTWGKNFEFQLGHSDKKERPAPSLITALAGPGQSIVYASCGSDFTMAVDSNRLVWGWGKNDLCQLGFESLTASEKEKSSGGTAGRILTIQRPNKGGQRTIQLPQDSRTYVSKPTRVAGLRSMWPAETNADENERESRRKYSRKFLIESMRALKGHYDSDELMEACRRSEADDLVSYLHFLNGDLEESLRIALGWMVRNRGGELSDDRAESTLSFFVDAAEKVEMDVSRRADLLRIVFSLAPRYLDLNDFIQPRLDFWAPAVVDLLIRDPRSVPLSMDVRLRAARIVREHRSKNVSSATIVNDPSHAKLTDDRSDNKSKDGIVAHGQQHRQNFEFVEVSRTDLVRATGEGDRYSYRFRCGHVIGESKARKTLEAMTEDEVLAGRSPRTIDYIRRFVGPDSSPESKLPSDLCPQCLTDDLRRVFPNALQSHLFV